MSSLHDANAPVEATQPKDAASIVARLSSASVVVELTIVDHCGRESRRVLNSLPAIVGRDEGADVRIEDPWMSRMHVMLNEINGTLVVRDLGAKNGVFLNGQRVIESHVLPGDRLTVGLTKITLRYARTSQPGGRSLGSSSPGAFLVTPSPQRPDDSDPVTMQLYR